MLQLNPLLPLEILYPETHNSEGRKIMEQHHSEFAKFIKNFKKVLEIEHAMEYCLKN